LGAKAIRTYGLVDCDLGTKMLSAAKPFDLKIILGMWLNRERKANEREIDKLRELISIHGNISTIVVGSEVLLRGDLPAEQLLMYVKCVKSFLSVPVTTAETWSIWAGHDARYPELSPLVDTIDLVFPNIFPYWERIEISNAVSHVRNVYRKLQRLYPKKQIIISESGWPSGGLANGPCCSVARKSEELYSRPVGDGRQFQQAVGEQLISVPALLNSAYSRQS